MDQQVTNGDAASTPLAEATTSASTSGSDHGAKVKLPKLSLPGDNQMDNILGFV